MQIVQTQQVTQAAVIQVQHRKDLEQEKLKKKAAEEKELQQRKLEEDRQTREYYERLNLRRTAAIRWEKDNSDIVEMRRIRTYNEYQRYHASLRYAEEDQERERALAKQTKLKKKKEQQ